MSEIEKQQHFVTFYSPGTFVPEETTKPVESWDVEAAMKMAHGIVERYNATPFGFRFSTRVRAADDLDSKESAKSPMYYLGGSVLTAKKVLSKTDPKEKILRDNVRANNIKRVIVNDNSWRTVLPLQDDDVVLRFKPRRQHKRAWLA